jgi:hypothetical protein
VLLSPFSASKSLIVPPTHTRPIPIALFYSGSRYKGRDLGLVWGLDEVKDGQRDAWNFDWLFYDTPFVSKPYFSAWRIRISTRLDMCIMCGMYVHTYTYRYIAISAEYAK